MLDFHFERYRHPKTYTCFPDRTDNRLREFAAEEYPRRRRHDAAMKLMGAEFSERAARFRRLSHSRAAGQEGGGLEAVARVGHCRGPAAYPSARQKRLAVIFPLGLPDDASPLVRIYLYEGNPEAAWNAAQGGGCWNSLWIELPEKKEKTHPEVAVSIYRLQAETLRVIEKEQAMAGTVG